MEKEEKKRRKRAYNREHYWRHRDRILRKHAEERAADVKGTKAAARQYYQAKKDRILAHQAKYRDANRETINAKAREKRRAAKNRHEHRDSSSRD